jgi:hypothetical protein
MPTALWSKQGSVLGNDAVFDLGSKNFLQQVED